MFRYRPDKIKYLSRVETLSEKHNRIIETFKNQQEQIPTMKDLLNQYNEDLDKLEKENMKDFTNEQIKQRAELKEKIKKINENLKYIEEGTDDIEYYEKVNDILIDYYNNLMFVPKQNEENTELDILNKQSLIGKKIKRIPKSRIKDMEETSNQKTIIDYFNINIKEGSTTKNATLLNEYNKLISGDGVIKRRSIIRICPGCNVEKTLIQTDGYYVCPICGETDFIFMDNENSCYKDSLNEKPAYPYKRMNHLVEWLNQFQAKETTEIPNDIYLTILKEIRKNKIDINKLSVIKMKNLLKRLRLHQFYEHIPHIISRLSGTSAPIISRDLENKIKQIFREIQEPFMRFCPGNRKNFLSYSFCLHKIFELLGKNEFLIYFPLLKSPEKLREQDKLWRKICDYNNYEFYPSI